MLTYINPMALLAGSMVRPMSKDHDAFEIHIPVGALRELSEAAVLNGIQCAGWVIAHLTSMGWEYEVKPHDGWAEIQAHRPVVVA